MINENWSRWITASINDYIATQLRSLTVANVPIFVEGDPEMNPKDHQYWYELRLDGPFYRANGGGEWVVQVEINILVSSLINEDSVYDIRKWAGVASKALSGDIDLRRYGEEVGDDDTVFGCLRLGAVFQNHLGKIDPATQLQQATVETRATTELTGG